MHPQRPHSRSRPSGSFLALTFLTFLPAGPGHGQETFVVEGQAVSNRGGLVPVRVQLKLETLDGQIVADQPTDSRGQFRFINLQRNLYRLTASAEGFQTTQQSLDVRRGVGRYLITVTLTPLAKTPDKQGDVVSVTDLNAPAKARKAYEKGDRAYQKGKLTEACARLEEAVAGFPCYSRAHTRLGMTLELLGEFAAAETALKKAIECDAGFLEAHVQLSILLNHLKRFEECESRLQKTIGRFPASQQLHYQLAAAQYGLGRYREAEQEYVRA